MFENIFKIIYFILIILFLYFVLFTYFCRENINFINKFNTGEIKSEFNKANLPIIKNDTDDIILYNTNKDLEKKIKKRKIWELLK